MKFRPLLVGVGAAALVASCAGPSPVVPARPDVARYEDPRAWLCLPGRDDACKGDLTATAIHADKSRTVERADIAREPTADCFYVYPTVDLSLTPGNHDDFHDLALMTAATVAQAARFQESCALYVPLYRQVTIGTYLRGGDQMRQRLAFAFSDVEAAFAEYLATYNRGRPIVLLGHSQGAEMVTRLVKRFFDADPAMRARLLVAMPIGGDVEVPKGKVVGATFANVPVCTKEDETGCVVAYRSYAAGEPLAPARRAPEPGNELACVNPADVETNALRPLSRAYFPLTERTRGHLRGVDGVRTPWVTFGDFYAGQCVDGPNGLRGLAVSLVNAPGEERENPIDFDQMPLKKQMGLHLIDFQLAQGDLLDMVERRVIAARGK